jgi:hypothetical protein
MMKNIIYLTLAFLFISTGIFAQKEEVIEVESFNTLTVKGSFNIILHIGEPYLHFKSGDGSGIKVENANGVLSIVGNTENEILHDLHIGSSDFKNINLEIDGDFMVKERFVSFTTLNFNANIKGETKLELKGDVFVGNFNNCGKITIAGTVDNIYLKLSNSADLITTNLEAGSSSINHNN